MTQEDSHYKWNIGYTFIVKLKSTKGGERMKQQFLICRHCGNIVAMIRNTGVPIYCCGEEMEELLPRVTEASGEKHIPVYCVDGNTVHVSVGATEHPMTEAHYIEWICLESEHGIHYAHLKPTDKPKVKFALCEGDEVRGVYAFCNQHDLWRK